MSDPEPQTQPLIGASPRQTEVDMGGPAQGPRPTRAYKVAGLTLLACVLIVSQVAIVYFVVSQRSDLKNLQEQNNDMNRQLTRGRSGSAASVPMRFHLPMDTMSEMMDNTMDQDASTEASDKTAAPMTICQQEAIGLKPMKVPGFHPTCDQQGLYRPQQCFKRVCWCVDPVSGQERVGVKVCSTMAALPSGMLLMTNDKETD